MRTASIWVALCLAFVAATQAGDSNSLMELSRDGTRLACANRDSGTVTIIDLATNAKRAEIAVGQHPEGICFVGGSHQLAVAVYDDDRVVLLDADSGTITR